MIDIIKKIKNTIVFLLDFFSFVLSDTLLLIYNIMKVVIRVIEIIPPKPIHPKIIGSKKLISVTVAFTSIPPKKVHLLLTYFYTTKAVEKPYHCYDM